jgi:hypothetical protein
MYSVDMSNNTFKVSATADTDSAWKTIGIYSTLEEARAMAYAMHVLIPLHLLIEDAEGLPVKFLRPDSLLMGN